MTILGWIVLGGLAGWLASVLMHEREGCLMSVVIGIVGAVLGGFIFHVFGKGGITGFDVKSFVVALVGAIVLLAIIRAIRHR